jgi:hypothetical protein
MQRLARLSAAERRALELVAIQALEATDASGEVSSSATLYA